MTPAETAERMIRAIGRESWFSAVCETLTAAETAEAAAYLSALGRAEVGVAGLSNWPDAKAVADDPGWDAAWWDAEERLRLDLTRRAVEAHPESAVHEALSRIAAAATDVLQGAAAVAASGFGVADAALIKSAAGAATQACHHTALAWIASSAADHPFEAKFRLYQGGRWPLAIVRGTYYIL